jgi:hypothetical protein
MLESCRRLRSSGFETRRLKTKLGPSHREVGLVVSLNVSTMSERLEILRYMIERLQSFRYMIERLQSFRYMIERLQILRYMIERHGECEAFSP